MDAQLSIGNIAVRQFDQLYSLNDLHKASGGLKKHQPALWLRLDQTQALITEINSSTDMQNINSSDMRSIKIVQGKGKNQGTYACKELVIAYAAWISPAFHLQVIRCFLDTIEPTHSLAPHHINHPHTDPWTPMVYRYITARVNRHVGAFSLDEIAECALGIRANALHRGDRMRLGTIMRTIGFERKRETVQVGGRPRRYFYKIDPMMAIVNPYEPLVGEWEHAPTQLPPSVSPPCMNEADKHNLLAVLTTIPVLNEDAKPLLEIGRQLQSKPLISLWSMIDHLYFLSHGCTKAVQAMP